MYIQIQLHALENRRFRVRRIFSALDDNVKTTESRFVALISLPESKQTARFTLAKVPLSSISAVLFI